MQRLDRLVFWVRTLMKMLAKVDEHLFRTMSRRLDLAFDGRLYHGPIKNIPSPLYLFYMTGNDGSSPQSVAIQMNTGASLSTSMFKGQCTVYRYGCQLYEKVCH